MGMLLGDGSGPRKPNTLPIWGSPTTMNLNPLILTNIQTSPYYTGRLTEIKTYHEIVDEIYYKVTHLEPWERGSRANGGRRQTGMCGGVRGVGVGGIISSPFCLLYKLFSMRPTRKQVYGLLNHTDSPYIRGIGFLYVRYTQPPPDFWDWYEPYLNDPEEIDVRAGGGQIMTVGEMARHFLTRLDWFSTLFPRIPVPIQISMDKKLSALQFATSLDPDPPSSTANVEEEPVENRSRKPEATQRSKSRSRSRDAERRRKGRSRSRSRERRHRSRSGSKGHSSRSSSSSSKKHKHRDRDRERDRSSRSYDDRDRVSGSRRHHHR